MGNATDHELASCIRAEVARNGLGQVVCKPIRYAVAKFHGHDAELLPRRGGSRSIAQGEGQVPHSPDLNIPRR